MLFDFFVVYKEIRLSYAPLSAPLSAVQFDNTMLLFGKSNRKFPAVAFCFPCFTEEHTPDAILDSQSIFVNSQSRMSWYTSSLFVSLRISCLAPS